VREGVIAVFGDVEVAPARLPHEVAPGSKLGAYLRILGVSWLYDAIGAWDPAFGSREALEGKERARVLAHAVLEELDAPDDPNRAALEAQNDRRKSKIAQASYLRTKQVAPRSPRSFAGPARTREELRFAASMEHCPRCNDRIEEEAAELRALGGGLWEVAGPCSRCGEVRTVRYPATADLERTPPLEHQLGPGPSAMLTTEHLREALDEALPLVAPLPAQLDEEDREISAQANRRALLCLHELIKLESSPSERAVLVEECERQLALREAHAAALSHRAGDRCDHDRIAREP
jgi:hypothetical protein